MSTLKRPRHCRAAERLGWAGAVQPLHARDLNDPEPASLLALLLDANQGPVAMARARRDLQACASLRQLFAPEAPDSMSPLRWMRLRAAVELMRHAELETLVREPVLESPQAVRRFLMLWLRDRPVECFVGIFLDSQHRVVAARELFQGSLTQTAVYPREVARLALRLNAAAVILAHNHPSGVAEPSRADRQLTEALSRALRLLDIGVLDHLIVAGGHCLSFAQEGWL